MCPRRCLCLCLSTFVVAAAACGGQPREAELPVLDPDNCECIAFDKPVAPKRTEPAPDQPILDAATIAARYATPADTAPSPTSPAWTGRRIDLDVKDADLHNVFRLLSDVGGINIVVADDVRGSITLRLRDMPWDQVLDAIIRSQQLTVRQNGSILLIGR